MPASYTFNNSTLSQDSAIKYLGIKIDSHLFFFFHIREICKRATLTLHMLMRNLTKGRTKTRLFVYKTICRPILEYASHTCSPHLVKHINVIEAKHCKAFRWAYHDQISELMSEVNWETLIGRSADLKLYFKITSSLAAFHPGKVSLSQSDQHQTYILFSYPVRR